MKYVVISAGLFFLCMMNGANGQVVVVGNDGQTLKEYCEQVEPLRPNLVLSEDTAIHGRISDQSTDAFRNSPIELRSFFSEKKQVTLKKVSTDENGNFDLGVVKRGDYRLLLSPSRAFKQPEKLECAGKKCTLDTVLIINPSDQLATNCPVR